MKRHSYIPAFLLLCLAWLNPFRTHAQGPFGLPDPLFEGPYNTFEGPYIIRVFINFFDPHAGQAGQWTGDPAFLTARAQGILDNLNDAFNKHKIYFVGQDQACSAPFQVVTSNVFSHLHPDCLDIFDRGDAGLCYGYPLDGVPGAFLEVGGTEENGMSASKGTTNAPSLLSRPSALNQKTPRSTFPTTSSSPICTWEFAHLM